MLSLPSPQHRILSAIVGVAHELHLDATLDPAANPTVGGTIYFYPAGMFDAVASLAYADHVNSQVQLILTDEREGGDVLPVVFHVEAAQAPVEALCAKLAEIVGVDPHIYAGPLRPRT